MSDVVQAVPIVLDKERHFKLTLGGMKKFQEATGKSLLKGFDFENANECELIALIWACLIWEDRNLTLDDVGYLLDVSQLNELAQKLRESIEKDMPRLDIEKSPNP